MSQRTYTTQELLYYGALRAEFAREEFAAAMLEPLRVLLAMVPCNVAELATPQELRDLHELLNGPLDRLMARAIRAQDAARARAAFDQAARVEREWTSA